jgi:ribonuclease P protein component
LPGQFTYKKNQRLKSRKLIDELFSKGKSISAFPLKVIYSFAPLPRDVALQAGVTVSSRNFKKAVDRNRVKRVLRESFRLHKTPLEQMLHEKQLQLAVFFIYTSKELPVWQEVEGKMSYAINKLVEITEKKPGI